MTTHNTHSKFSYIRPIIKGLNFRQSWPKMYRTACRNNNFLFKFDLILNSIPPRTPIQRCFLPFPLPGIGLLFHMENQWNRSNSNIEWVGGGGGGEAYTCLENDSSFHSFWPRLQIKDAGFELEIHQYY